MTEGAYVQQAQATLLATVQQLDPIYVDLTQSSVEGLQAAAQISPSGRLDGRPDQREGDSSCSRTAASTPSTGTLQFTDVTVDPGHRLGHGARDLSQPERGELLPGMFVRAHIEEGVNPHALLVPQQGVTRDQKGQPTALRGRRARTRSSSGRS